jgi:hypothetical protein
MHFHSSTASHARLSACTPLFPLSVRNICIIGPVWLKLPPGRIAMREDVIPLKTPYTDVNGAVHESVRSVFCGLNVAMLTLLKNPQGSGTLNPHLRGQPRPRYLGPRCIGLQVGFRTWYPLKHLLTQFRPERWEASTPISNSIPGVWGHMLTFLGGPRGCIGYRFALVE